MNISESSADREAQTIAPPDSTISAGKLQNIDVQTQIGGDPRAVQLKNELLHSKTQGAQPFDQFGGETITEKQRPFQLPAEARKRYETISFKPQQQAQQIKLKLNKLKGQTLDNEKRANYLLSGPPLGASMQVRSNQYFKQRTSSPRVTQDLQWYQYNPYLENRQPDYEAMAKRVKDEQIQKERRLTKQLEDDAKALQQEDGLDVSSDRYGGEGEEKEPGTNKWRTTVTSIGQQQKKDSDSELKGHGFGGRNAQQHQLTNEFNEVSALQLLKKGLQDQVAQKTLSELLKGSKIKRHLKKPAKATSNQLTPARDLSGQMQDTVCTDGENTSEEEFCEGELNQEIDDFFQNFEIEDMISHKSLIVDCIKLRNQRFFLKELTSDVRELEMYVQRENGQAFVSNGHNLNHRFSFTNVKVIKPWTDMLPQLPRQHVMQCYGITKIMDRYYQICDLVEDFKELPCQEAEIGGEAEDEQHRHDTVQRAEHMNLQRLLAFSQQDRPKAKVSKNVYEMLNSMSLGNLSSLKEIPAYFIGSLLQYINQTSQSFIHAHRIDLIHGAFNLSKVVAQKRHGGEEQGCGEGDEAKDGLVDDSHPNTALNSPTNASRGAPPTNAPEFDPAAFNSYTYILTNFEPWTVDQMIRAFEHTRPGNPFYNALTTDRLKLGRRHYLQLCKLLDLQAFGNSIIEMMVGKTQEEIKIKDKDIMMKMNDISRGTAHSDTQKLLGKRSSLAGKPEGPSAGKSVTLEISGLPGQSFKPGDSIDQIRREQKDKDLYRQESSAKSSLEKQIQKEIKENQNNVTGGIPLDSLPLNWIKQREIVKILEIVNKCLGPYGANNNFEDFDTVKAFQEINKIAVVLFEEAKCTYRADAAELDTHTHAPHGSEVEHHHHNGSNGHMSWLSKYYQNEKLNQRLTSSIMNNKNILTWLSITDDTYKELRDRTLQDIYYNLNMAIEYYPKNTVAHLNKIMFEWRTGLIRDDEVVTYLKTEMRQLDPEAAELMFLIFKKNVYGSAINDNDYIMAIDNYDKHSCSTTKLSQHLYFHQDIQEQKAQNDVQMQATSKDSRKQSKLAVRMMESLKSVYKNTNVPSQNQSFQLPANFNPKSLVISNNEIHITVIGEEEMMMIDSRSGKQTHKMALPKWEAVEKIEQFGPVINECAHGHGDAGGHEHEEGEEHGSQSECEDSHSHHSHDSHDEDGSDDQGSRHPKGTDSGSVEPSSCDEYNAQEALDDAPKDAKAPRRREVVAQSSKPQSGSYVLKEGGHTDPEQEEKPRQMVQRGERTSTDYMSGATNPKTPHHLGLRGESQESDVLFSGSFSHNIQTTGGNSPKLHSVATLNNVASGSTLNDQKTGVRVSFDYSKVIQNAQRGAQGKQLRKISVDDRALQSLKNAKKQAHLPTALGALMTPDPVQRQEMNRELSASGAPRTTNPSRTKDDDVSKPAASSNGGPKSRPTSTLSERQNRQELFLFRDLIQKESEKMHELFPPVWKADNMNNGKIFALFDVAQQDRNKRYKFNSNKKEHLCLYTIFAGRHTSLQVCNMKQLLDSEEVLHFAFNDFNEDFSCIMVQAKNLHLYQIDFNKHEVLQKIVDYPHSICMKSIFYNVDPQHKEQALTQSQELKELIEDEEQNGNKVLIPKINPNVLAIQQGTSNLIKIYSLKLKRITRQFILTPQLVPFFDELEPDEEEPGVWRDEPFETLLLNLEDRKEQRDAAQRPKLRKFVKNQHFQNGGFLDALKLSEHAEKKEIYDQAVNPTGGDQEVEAEGSGPATGRGGKRRGHADKRQLLDFAQWGDAGPNCAKGGREPATPCDANHIHLIEISPNGRIIVSHVGNCIFIRMLNHPGLHGNEGIFDYSIMMEERPLNPFMPIYCDLDYTHDIQVEESGGAHDHSSDEESSVMEKSSASGHRDDQGSPSHTPPPGADAPIVYKIPNNIIDRMDKLSPGTVDRACYAWFSLKKWTGSVYNKNEKLIELLPFIQAVLQHPQLLFESPLRKKNRLQKIGQAFKLIRCYYEYAKEISLVRLNGIQKFSVFDQLSLTRSHEYIKSFTGASVSSTNICALFVDRKLQLYDIVTEKLLFELNFPSAGAYCLTQGMQKPMSYHKIFFLENDQLIMTQDAENRLALVNVAGQIDLFGHNSGSVQNRDLTFKIEEPVVDVIPIKNDFRVGVDEQDDKKKVSDDDDDVGQAATHIDQTFITYDEPIHSVFCAPSTSQYAYVALIGRHRFTIYDTYDNNFGGVEVKMVWDGNFRFDKQQKSLGQIHSLEFAQDARQFVTGTQLGWICFWDMEEKRLTRRFKVINPSNPDAPEQCNIVKSLAWFGGTKYLYCYNVKSQNLFQNVATLFATDEEQQAYYEKGEDADRGNTSNAAADASYLKAKRAQTPAKGTPKAESRNRTNQDNDRLASAPPTKRKNKKLEVDWIEVTTGNVFHHLSVQDKLKLGVVQEIKTDLREQFLIVSFEHGYILVYKVCIENHNHRYSPVCEYGPFESSRQVFIDDYCTYLGVLTADQKEIIFQTFEWQYNVKRLTKLPGSNKQTAPGMLKALTSGLQASLQRELDRLAEGAPGGDAQKKATEQSKACIIF